MQSGGRYMIPVTGVVLRRVFLSFMKLCADVLLSILSAIPFPLVLAIGIGGQALQMLS